jgi:hypothetical protein
MLRQTPEHSRSPKISADQGRSASHAGRGALALRDTEQGQGAMSAITIGELATFVAIDGGITAIALFVIFLSGGR